MFQSMQKRMQM